MGVMAAPLTEAQVQAIEAAVTVAVEEWLATQVFAVFAADVEVRVRVHDVEVASMTVEVLSDGDGA